MIFEILTTITFLAIIVGGYYFAHKKGISKLKGVGIAAVAGISIVSPAIILDVQNSPEYLLDCELKEFTNKTVVGYETIIRERLESKNTCTGTYKNGTPICVEEFQLTNKTIKQPIVDGSTYSMCIPQEVKSIKIANKRLSKVEIDLKGKVHNVDGDTLTIKDLSQGGSYLDGMPHACIHPNIPCEQYNITTGERIE